MPTGPVPEDVQDADRADRKTEKSYLSSAVDSINPWALGTRSSTPTNKDAARDTKPASSVAGGDHSTTHLYGQSSKSYPPDCPKLKVLWFHAVDVPKRKPRYRKTDKSNDTKPPAAPKKYVEFSSSDSRSIESAYQKLLEGAERGTQSDPTRSSTRVPVNEDYLFDVDIEQRELAPVYWLGPVYEVRRGTWFYQEGSTLRPCEENLASQLEEGFLKIRPWLYPPPKPRAEVTGQGKSVSSKGSSENLREDDASAAPVDPTSAPLQPKSYRLFGTYMNSFATYQDASTAWLSTDSMLSWVTSTMYERFSGGGYMSGVKLVRGWTNLAKAGPAKSSEMKAAQARDDGMGSKEDTISQDEQLKRKLKRRSAPPSTGSVVPGQALHETSDKARSPEFQLQRQLSSFITGSDPDAPEDEEALDSRAEQEIQDDYTAQSGEKQGRDIEHLCLVTHGIGQLLGMRMESMNFVHDVNVMRKTLKSTYANSADLRALNSESDDNANNSRVQVLPVCWRHLLDFPKKREKKNERDLADLTNDEDEYPSLEDITVEGGSFARSLISDLALDVLLYQSAYREQISAIVLQESNRIYKLFKERNPEFKGKVHIVGHSLGSAIMFDILCRQKEEAKHHSGLRNPLRFWPSASQEHRAAPREANELRFDFDVEDFYCLGSPVGLFQMLKGRTISARHLPGSAPSQSPLNSELAEDPFAAVTEVPSSPVQRISPITGLPSSISSPKVGQLFNIFHPSDPIGYRLEPLISPAMSRLKPQALPYTKKGIFGSVTQQGLSGIGVKVGQSVSGFWSSLSSGIASNILNRSLGISSDDMAKMNSVPGGMAPADAQKNLAESEALSDASKLGEKTNQRKQQLADSATNAEGRVSMSGNEMTLIDDELETLYAKFQKTRSDLATTDKPDPGMEWVEAERKNQHLKREDMKVRAMNRNARVDYSIQESVLDFNPINSIASHMGYWADEDVNHFILSQLLSNKSRTKASHAGAGKSR